MKVTEAKSLVLSLIHDDLTVCPTPVLVDATSPDPGDPGKFTLAGRTARVIHRFSGWHVPIHLGWFDGGFDPPHINRVPFYWYVFAIPTLGRYRRPHYLICDYLQVRSWVLEFAAPKGHSHRDHCDWRADIHVDRSLTAESQAYFRWGDELAGDWRFLSRVVRLDNVATLAQGLQGVGPRGLGGESEAHRRLKLYIAQNPQLLGLRQEAVSDVEHRFVTADRVDVLFRNHNPIAAVAEVELEGDDNLVVGVHQAIKYRSLAAAENALPLGSQDVRAFVVAYSTAGAHAHVLAQRYDVRLVGVERREVLAAT